VARSRRWILALDVGGTNMSGALFKEDGGNPLAVKSRRTPAAEGPEGVVAAGLRLLDDIRDEAVDQGVDPKRIVGAGVGVPGTVEPGRGIVSLAPNLGWRDVPIRDLFQDQLGLPVVVDNDANCAALGEWWVGAGRGSRLMIAATLGTGIGGGIVQEGRVLRGVAGAAGEIGHMTIEMDGRSCQCGNQGCLEAYASGTGIGARAREALRDGAESAIRHMVDSEDQVTAAVVAQAAQEGDMLGRLILRETARYLAAGLASLINVLNPDRIVLAGGVVKTGGLLLDPVREEVRRRAFPASAETCVIAAARDPELAGVRGAALTFQREVLEGHR